MHRVVLVNRRPERAASLAANCKADSLPWTELGSLLPVADLVFVTTGARHALVRADDLAAATAQRSSDLVMLDLAVPRNVEPAARALAKSNSSIWMIFSGATVRQPVILLSPLQRRSGSSRTSSRGWKRASGHVRPLRGSPSYTDSECSSPERKPTARSLVSTTCLTLSARSFGTWGSGVRRMLYPVSRELREVLPSHTDGARWTA